MEKKDCCFHPPSKMCPLTLATAKPVLSSAKVAVCHWTRMSTALPKCFFTMASPDESHRLVWIFTHTTSPCAPEITLADPSLSFASLLAGLSSALLGNMIKLWCLLCSAPSCSLNFSLAHQQGRGETLAELLEAAACLLSASRSTPLTSSSRVALTATTTIKSTASGQHTASPDVAR